MNSLKVWAIASCRAVHIKENRGLRSLLKGFIPSTVFPGCKETAENSQVLAYIRQKTSKFVKISAHLHPELKPRTNNFGGWTDFIKSSE
jgi:hypothetical protein